ncbi:LuxR C-terminal-related transcriptional regulator [Vibrio salinus]|uniref:LuxR C-terminal-related transcriptional regulator n=1 Tax=Vibrio salinus TaxID=2899784 RepID=UPI001E51DEB7|nr:LuxR C-terminal-related transcriptional regulator [Vibrio salinus]MCE0493446.1 LuxR C-terminal-related transcriptional regulator [Vibrio salinus]
MQRTNYQRTLYFLSLSKETGYRSVHLEYLHSQFKFSSQRIDTLDDLTAPQFTNYPHKIYVIDFNSINLVLPIIKQNLLHKNRGETVVINVPIRLTTDTLISFGNLKGLFYTSSQYKDINKGLEEILDGQQWLPRKVVSQLLHFYRYHFENLNINAALNLTSREVEILRSLETGGSNQRIADSLCISEPTVKSHLYQIYKKINVKNRTQAIGWMRNNCNF